MTIEDTKNIVQIAFWLLAILLGVLTYFNARKNLLSPVNTEYQKKVFGGLERVANKISNELIEGSENYIGAQRPMQATLEEIVHEFKGQAKALNEHGLSLTEWAVPEMYGKLRSLADEFRYELFLPEDLRHKIVAHVDQQAEAVNEASIYAVDSYVQCINERRAYDEISMDNWVEIENYFIEGMERAGFDEASLQSKVRELLDAMSTYVTSFSPKKSNKSLQGTFDPPPNFAAAKNRRRLKCR